MIGQLNVKKKGGVIIIAGLYLITSIIFGLIYYSIRGNNNFKGLDEKSSFIDCLYFSLTTTSTVGYGDISPKSELARLFVILHQITLLSEIVIFVANSFR